MMIHCFKYLPGTNDEELCDIVGVGAGWTSLCDLWTHVLIFRVEHFGHCHFAPALRVDAKNK